MLLRKWINSRGDYRDLLGRPVVCDGRDRAIVPDGIEKYVAVAAARPGCQAVLVVLDAEGDPACELGPVLLTRAGKNTRLPVAICLAERYWEDWLYASIETLELGSDVEYSPNKRGLGAIVKVLPGKYVKPTWQPRLTNRVDINTATQRSKSLKRMLERFDALLAHMPPG